MKAQDYSLLSIIVKTQTCKLVSVPCGTLPWEHCDTSPLEPGHTPVGALRHTAAWAHPHSALWARSHTFHVEQL